MHRSEPAAVWPAAFSFDQDEAVCVLHSSADTPLRAEIGDGEVLDGLVAIGQSDLSPSAALYLWLWAAIYADDPVHGMDFRFRLRIAASPADATDNTRAAPLQHEVFAAVPMALRAGGRGAVAGDAVVTPVDVLAS
jgi:hypothetical protein